MCDPVTLSLAATAATTAMSATSALVGGMQQAQSYRAQAKFADRQATIEGQKGAYEARRAADRNDRRLAAIRSGYLSSGIALTGSPADVIADSATEASLDEQAIRYGAQIKSDNYAFEAEMGRMNAGQAMLGGFLGAAGSVAGGFSEYQDYQSRRTFLSNPYLSYGGAY